ncbi:MAG: hypothetical protein DRO88_11335 [Promethearchaeia archaeon]|nr:MAG: hypothetical protein DRO88_11335 [Candidatus Lokiarchaeia archaeon]
MKANEFHIFQIEDTRPVYEIEKEITSEWKIPKYFNKLSLKRLIEGGCLRQAFLYLPNSPQWRNPLEKPKPRIPARAGSEFAMKQGHIYEQTIYSHLTSFANCIFTRSIPKNVFLKRKITPDLLNAIYQKCVPNNIDEVFILEGEFNAGDDFFEAIFHAKNPQDPLPITYSKFRPDIIVLKRLSLNNSKHSSISYLNYNNRLTTKVPNTSQPIYGISIIDIKHVLEPNIGKSHFIEILYYMHAMAWYLHKHTLDDKFLVISEGNGILPRLDPSVISQINCLDDLYSNMVIMDWNNVVRMYYDVIWQFQWLWKQAPCSIASIPLNIQPLCGSCQFLNDCLYRLGVTEKNPVENWALEVIPYANTSVIMQLKQLGFKTVGDVAKRIHTIQVGSIPQPIYAEIPFLKQRAEALVQGKPIYPPKQQMYSYAIPKYSPISLIFTIESDPLNERVFGFALLLEMMVPKKAPNYPKFHQWWKIWKEGLTHNKTPAVILQDLQQANPFYKDFPINEIKIFHHQILNNIPLEITIEGQILPDQKIAPRTKVKYHFEVLNQSVSNPQSELNMLFKIIKILISIFKICSILENRLIFEKKVVNRKNKKVFYQKHRLDLSVYYWAQDQIKNMQNVMERNLEKLIIHPNHYQKLLEIIQYFTPAESEVEHPYQHHKLFDLRKFTETVVGFPALINYTWHEIGAAIFNTNFKKKFWLQHFNYMDYQVWYEYLEAKELAEKQVLKDEILKQLARKAKYINLLRKKFQVESTDIIPWESNPVSLDLFNEISLPPTFHKIAHLWYFFAKLTGAIQELEVDEIRTMYPNFSISKLNAAEVQNLQYIPNLGKGNSYYLFEIRNLSSNMKIKEKDRVLLIPNELRDRKIGKWTYSWMVEIERMVWKSKINGFQIKTAPHRNDLVTLYQQTVPNPKKITNWYLYPLSLDAWSNKLYNARGSGLLQNNHFGDSILGFNLVNKWKINTIQLTSLPKTQQVEMPEIFLYYPEILSNLPQKPKSFVSIQNSSSYQLITKAYPAPDPSQKDAISKALNSFIYAIQGPPGTGKSQTITTLLDEYICRIKQKRGSNAPINILITAFSYAALRVLIDKIRNSRDQFGNRTNVSSIQLIFLHSESVDPIDDEPNLPHIDDLLHKSSGSWQWNGLKRIITKKKQLQNVLKDQFILFGNAHQLYHLPSITMNVLNFDLIIVDEASQVPTDHFLASLQFIHSQSIKLSQVQSSTSMLTSQWEITSKNEVLETIDPDYLSQVVIVGDYFQLPPVQPVEPPKNVEPILGSLYSYYVRNHGIQQSQLQINYRSHPDIVEFTRQLALYQNLKAFFKGRNYTINGIFPSSTPSWIREIFQPDRVVCALIHEHQFEIAISQIEAHVISQIVLYYWISQKLSTKIAEKAFWLQSVGVVSPHNAQGRLILRQIFTKMTNNSHRLTLLDDEELMECLQATIYSVEKFQGSDRELIIASIGISDKDHLKKEEEFIYDLNRFNVLTSRAKRKLIYICSRNFLEYIPHDKTLINYAAQSYKYAVEFCNQEEPLFLNNYLGQSEYIYFRWHDRSLQNPKKLFSSFNYEGNLINQASFEFTATNNPDFLSIIQNLPKDQRTFTLRSDKKVIRGKITIKDPEKDYATIPIPKSISYLLPVVHQKEENSNSQTPKPQSSLKQKISNQKTSRKLEEKKIAIKLEDEDEDLL